METSELGVAIIAHTGHRRFIKPCLESCREMNPAKIIVAYDCRFTAKEDTPMESILPTYDVFRLADGWAIGDIGPRVNSWLWLTQNAISLLKNSGVKYILSINGDCVLENPQGIHDIYKRMCDQGASVISCELRGEGFAGTTSYFATIDSAVKIADHLVKNAFEARTPEGKGFGNPEGRMGKAISLQGLKCAEVKNPEHAQFSYGDRGTWGEVLGFQHLHGAEKWRKGNNKTPFPKEHYDLRYLRGNELIALGYFWETGKTDKLIEHGYWKNNI